MQIGCTLSWEFTLPITLFMSVGVTIGVRSNSYIEQVWNGKEQSVRDAMRCFFLYDEGPLEAALHEDRWGSLDSRELESGLRVMQWRPVDEKVPFKAMVCAALIIKSPYVIIVNKSIKEFLFMTVLLDNKVSF